jgi:hypothetical protein
MDNHCQYTVHISPKFEFSKICAMRHEDTTEIEHFFPRSSSENTRKMFNHGKFRVVVGTQNHLRIRGTNLWRVKTPRDTKLRIS